MTEPVLLLEAEDLDKLRQIRDALYGDGRVLTPDQRRDLAHRLGLIVDRAVLYTPESTG